MSFLWLVMKHDTMIYQVMETEVYLTLTYQSISMTGQIHAWRKLSYYCQEMNFLSFNSCFTAVML